MQRSSLLSRAQCCSKLSASRRWSRRSRQMQATRPAASHRQLLSWCRTACSLGHSRTWRSSSVGQQGLQRPAWQPVRVATCHRGWPKTCTCRPCLRCRRHSLLQRLASTLGRSQWPARSLCSSNCSRSRRQQMRKPRTLMQQTTAAQASLLQWPKEQSRRQTLGWWVPGHVARQAGIWFHLSAHAQELLVHPLSTDLVHGRHRPARRPTRSWLTRRWRAAPDIPMGAQLGPRPRTCQALQPHSPSSSRSGRSTCRALHHQGSRCRLLPSPLCQPRLLRRPSGSGRLL